MSIIDFWTIIVFAWVGNIASKMCRASTSMTVKWIYCLIRGTGARKFNSTYINIRRRSYLHKQNIIILLIVLVLLIKFMWNLMSIVAPFKCAEFSVILPMLDRGWPIDAVVKRARVFWRKKDKCILLFLTMYELRNEFMRLASLMTFKLMLRDHRADHKRRIIIKSKSFLNEITEEVQF